MYNIYIEYQCIRKGGVNMEIDKGLIGGSTVLMLLSLLENGDCYGYEIIKKIDEIGRAHV